MMDTTQGGERDAILVRLASLWPPPHASSRLCVPSSDVLAEIMPFVCRLLLALGYWFLRYDYWLVESLCCGWIFH